jgi:hypothetical protein
MSLGDAIGLASAINLNGVFVTSDSEFVEPKTKEHAPVFWFTAILLINDRCIVNNLLSNIALQVMIRLEVSKIAVDFQSKSREKNNASGNGFSRLLRSL